MHIASAILPMFPSINAENSSTGAAFHGFFFGMARPMAVFVDVRRKTIETSAAQERYVQGLRKI